MKSQIPLGETAAVSHSSFDSIVRCQMISVLDWTTSFHCPSIDAGDGGSDDSLLDCVLLGGVDGSVGSVSEY